MKLKAPFLTDPKQIKAWLDSMGVKDWELNKAGLVDVVGTVLLGERLGLLTRLPVRFGKVGGNFHCNNNQLVSLEGSPEQVGKCFFCHNNQLESLKGAPKEVGGDFYCHNNQLVSLEGSPEQVGVHFYCHGNRIVSLEGAPKGVGGNFSCSNNQLESLKGVPKDVGGGFRCDHNLLASLEGAPEEVDGNFQCDHNLLVDFKGMEGVCIEGSLMVTDSKSAGQDNVFVSLDGLPKELQSKVRGLDISFVLELAKKRSAKLLVSEVEELISEVELG